MEDNAGYRVRLVSVASFLRATSASAFEQVIFKISPVLTESRRVEYSPVSPIHMPGSIQVYKNTPSRDFRIEATLISRTQEEALDNMKQLQLLRAWCMPYFGESTTLDNNQEVFRRQMRDSEFAARQPRDLASISSGVEILGAPPDVLYLYGYSSSNHRPGGSTSGNLSKAQAVNIHKVPVVLTGLSFSYPNDVDYLPTSDVITSPFPVKMMVGIDLAETHSPSEYQTFKLSDFKTGSLVNF